MGALSFINVKPLAADHEDHVALLECGLKLVCEDSCDTVLLYLHAPASGNRMQSWPIAVSFSLNNSL
eukprot:3763361-Pyramimonas_sp.AAC.1